jgi:hypothetical protein
MNLKKILLTSLTLKKQIGINIGNKNFAFIIIIIGILMIADSSFFILAGT